MLGHYIRTGIDIAAELLCFHDNGTQSESAANVTSPLPESRNRRGFTLTIFYELSDVGLGVLVGLLACLGDFEMVSSEAC